MLDSLYVNDAAYPWWTNISSFDTQADQIERVEEFISFSRYCEAACPIFVGHSLFFKLFYSRRLSKFLSTVRPELAANLKKFRLGNASVLAMTVLYSSQSDLECTILDADLIFGGGFHTHGNSRGRNQSIDSANNTPITRKSKPSLLVHSVLERASNLASVIQNGLFEDDRDKDREKEKDNRSSVGPNGSGLGSSFSESFSSFAKKVINSVEL
jgi:hypothetical protein